MLVFDPKRRITAAEALVHPYFSQFGFSPGTSSPSSSSTLSSSRSSVRRSDQSDSSMNLSHDTSGSSVGDSSLLDKSS